MVDRLTAENVKVNTDMHILRDEHTEVLHQMFNFEQKNSTLLRENNHLRSVNEGINQDLSTILIDRSKLNNQIMVTTQAHDISAEQNEQNTMLNACGSPLINKPGFQLGSLSPTSDNIPGAHMMMQDQAERMSQER